MEVETVKRRECLPRITTKAGRNGPTKRIGKQTNNNNNNAEKKNYPRLENQSARHERTFPKRLRLREGLDY